MLARKLLNPVQVFTAHLKL